MALDVEKKSIREIARLIFFFSIFAFVFYGLGTMPRISVPLTIAYLVYLIVNPAIPTMMKFGMNRGMSISLLFIGLLFFSIYPIVKIVPTITNEVENLQYYIPKVERYVIDNYSKLKITVKDKTGYEIDDKYVNEGIKIARAGTTNFLLSMPTFIASLIEWIFLVPLFVFFMLKDARSFKRLILKLTPNTIFERFYQLTHQFNKQLGDYIFAKFVEASIVGIIITSGLLIMGVRFSLLLGIIAGITNIIPYVGPILGAVPAIILGTIEYGFGAQFGAICMLYLIANSVDIALVFPILVSKIVNLHPIVVVISVILGSQYLGIMGMVISIPLAAAAKLIILEIYNEIYPSRWK